MANAPDAELHKGLKQRHLTMIAIGGVIGAGLFVGSGAVINEVGPAAFLTYAVTGVLIVMVMRMLGEMATANPSTGSFADYARKALGGWAGFSVGWLYWYFWVIVVLVLGSLFVIGLWPGRDADFSNLTAHGGCLPNGPGAIFSGIVVVIFSM